MAPLPSVVRRAVLVASLLLSPMAHAGPTSPGERLAPGDRVERTDATPKPLENVDVTEHLGAELPRGLALRDEKGKDVTLGSYFDGKLPVVLTFNYSNCPMLCSLMLNGFVAGMKQIDFVPGRDFRIVTVSIDHQETTERAERTKRRYLAEYGRPEAESGWHFLTASEENVAAYAKALGFGYFYNEERKEYAHPSAMAVASPDATIVRYLYGIEYPPRSLSLALLEASEGKIGNPFDRLVLYCFHYDSAAGRYAPKAAAIMRIGGGISVVILIVFVALLLRAESRKKRASAAPPKPAESVS
jgi:protein SCO1/2